MNKKSVNLLDLFKVRLEAADNLFVIDNAEKVTRNVCLHRPNSESILHGVRNSYLFQLICRKLHLVELALAIDNELTGKSCEYDTGCILFVVVEKNKCSAECSMTAKVDFTAGGEPAQVPFFAFFYGKSGFRKIVFFGDAHHEVLGQPLFQYADSGLIAMKYLV